MANPPAKQAPVSSAPKVMQGGGAKNKNQNAQQNQGAGNSNSIVSKVLERLRTCDNVLVTLSKNPTIDELTAALGFTYILDKIGKHVTAIFSGAIPNIIEFLEPEKTFEQNTNSLQDFIIAINKEKADHLRYKIEGDYVKVFITPYKTTITESDMEFSHGDYNVDLVVALNVPTEDELDAALTEYGRIKHDASSINISAHEPAKFGDLEWGDPESSSVSEMIARLASHIRIEGIEIFDKTIATTLLTGIIAATNRFSNERTSAETMAISAKLLGAGADQQLISSNVPVDILTTEPEPAPAPAAAETEYDEDTVLADDVKDESETVAETAARATERAKAVEEARRKAAEEKIAAAKAAKAAKDPTAFMIDHSEKAEPAPEPVAEPEPVAIEEAEPEPVVETAPVESEPAAEAAPAEVSAAEEADRIATQTRQESGEQSGPSVDELIAARQAIEDRLRAELGNGQGASDAARANASVTELDHALATAAAAAPISPAAVVVDKVNLDGTAVPAATIDAAAAAAVPQIASAGGGVKHVIEPSKPEDNPQNVKDYGAMMDAALGESASAPVAPTAPVVSTPDIAPATVPAMPEPVPVAAPAAVTVAPAAVAMPPVAPAMQAPVAPAPAPAPSPAPMSVAEPAEAPIADVDFAPEPAPVAPEPAAPQVSFTMPEPTAAQLPTMPAPSVPDLNQILPPPPPAPFTPAAPEPVMPSPSGAVDMSAPAGDIQLPVVPIQPATLTEAGDDTPKGNTTNNVYPDPAAFHIPGM